MAKGYAPPLLLVEQYIRDKARVFPLYDWSSYANGQRYNVYLNNGLETFVYYW